MSRMPLIRKLKALGAHVAVGAPMIQFSADSLSDLARTGVPVHDIPIDRHSTTSPLADLNYTRRVRSAVQAERADVFFPYTIKSVIFGTFGARLAGATQIIPTVTGLGSVFIEEKSSLRGRVVRWIATALYRLAFSFADTVYFQNHDDARELQKLGALRADAQVGVLAGSGVDVELFKEMPFPDASLGEFRFLMISRLLANKGLREFAEASRLVKQRHPGVMFDLIGSPDTNPSAISIDEVRSWTWINHIPCADDVRPALASSSVYVLPSYREGTARSVLEAMAVGRPIISTDAPGCREPVQDGLNGFLVPPRTVEPLASAMLRLIDQPSLITKMGAESRRIACEKYNSALVFDDLIRKLGYRPG